MTKNARTVEGQTSWNGPTEANRMEGGRGMRRDAGYEVAEQRSTISKRYGGMRNNSNKERTGGRDGYVLNGREVERKRLCAPR